MSEYICTIRTNYFHVKDVDAFYEFMGRAHGSTDFITIWKDQDQNGQPIFAFGTYGGISGVKDPEDDGDCLDESAYGEFIYGLQELVAEDDAIILLEAGHEKLRYVTGAATVLTCRDHTCLDLSAMAAKQAAEMLQRPDWKTKCDY